MIPFSRSESILTKSILNTVASTPRSGLMTDFAGDSVGGQDTRTMAAPTPRSQIKKYFFSCETQEI